MAAITVNIDDTTYEHALALFAFCGKTAEEAVKELFERASYDEYPRYEQLSPALETEAAIRETQLGINLSEPFDTIEELKEALHAEDQV